MTAKITPRLAMIHLDLKGMVFRDSYLPRLLDDLAEQKINSLLVEYEDVFPFAGMKIASDPSVVWPLKLVKKFNTMAAQRGIEIVPLFQCLGHLEYLLAWGQYRRLAEDKKYPSTIKLRDPAALTLISNMLQQMLEAHPNSRFIHLGMDEAHGLKVASKRLGESPLSLYLEHLETILPIVESADKKPLIWSDMLEDHYEPLDWSRWRKRVVLCSWDYSTNMPTTHRIRWHGNHISKAWMEDATNLDGPAVHEGQTYIEDQPQAIRKMVEPYMANGRIQTLFQVDLWTKLGFQVLSTSAIRASAQGPLLADYNFLSGNVNMHSQTVQRTNQIGQIGSIWARGTSWCPPNFPFEICWPLIHEMSRSMGLAPSRFWPGVDAREINWILAAIGRTKNNWRLENTIVDKMKKLAPSIQKHGYEWKCLMLMVQTLAVQRKSEYALLEVDYFDSNNRPVDSEWQRRLDNQAAILKELKSLRTQVERQFSRRYHGLAFAEWISELFDLHLKRIHECQKIAQRKKLQAARRYR
jgi:hypothetical protein